MKRYNYAHAWMDCHWGHIENGLITEWQAAQYVVAMAFYYGAKPRERKKLREELANEH